MPSHPANPSPAVKPQLHIGSASYSEFFRQIEEEIPFLRRNARRWHRQKTDADDLVQDTLVQALAKAHLWQPGSNLRAWLFTIMHHQFLAAVNRSSRSAGWLQARAVEDSAEASDSREARLALRDVGVALRRLPAQQRQVVMLAGV